MRNANILLGTVWLALALSGHAAGQMPSLASKPAGEKFTSQQCGFTIAMPARPTTTKAEENALTRSFLFLWEFREGRVFVQCGEFATDGAKATEKDGSLFIDGFKGGLLKALQPVSSFAEAPYKLGDYSGKGYSVLYKGNRVQVNVAVSGNKFFAVWATAYKEIPGSDDLVFSAAGTFGLIAPVRDKIA